MRKTCEAMYFEASKVGRPIWGKGDQKMTIMGHDDGWRRCRYRSEAEITVFGITRLVCKEHRRQVEQLKRRGSPLLQQLRWDA